eukprot:jgi/Pico_ML_1/53540/g4072.t1
MGIEQGEEKWSVKAWNASLPTFNRILEHPFIRELAHGSLDRDKFLFFTHQDMYYLADYGRVLGNIAVRLTQEDDIQSFMQFAREIVGVELKVHKKIVEDVYHDHEVPEPSPACMMYTSYLLAQLVKEPIEVALAAVLPCFWVYKEVGDHIVHLAQVENNPYQAWIDTYRDDEYTTAVLKAIEITDRYASATTERMRERMTQAFLYSTKMEWIFWDTAYRKENWPV